MSEFEDPKSPEKLPPINPPEKPNPEEPISEATGPGALVAVEGRTLTASQWWVIALVVALTSGALLYRLIWHVGLTHSAAMFLGVPAVLAILLALTPRAKSLTGGIVKGITLFLLIVAPLLGEGYLCILIASPLFYLVGIIVGWLAGVGRKSGHPRGTLSCVALLLLPMCLEGIVPQWTVDREQTVAVTRTLNAPPEAVEAALAASPRLGTRLPGFLRIGFPQPLIATGAGLELGSTRTLHFSGAEGDPPGDLVSRVTRRDPGFVRMETVSDTSKLTQWLRWQNSEVEWRAIDARHTAVTWRIHFVRQLDPAWYFVPWERFAVRQSAEYMIRANATPPFAQESAK
jgi:hypothetical protein